MAESTGKSEYVRADDARQILGVSKTRLGELLHEKRLPFYRNGQDRRKRWYKRSDVERVKAELAAMEQGE